MLKISDEITNEQFPYDNLPQQQNSNSVIRTILDETNFDGLQQIPHQLLKHLPGYDKIFFISSYFERNQRRSESGIDAGMG